jgi:hypothetical protein
MAAAILKNIASDFDHCLQRDCHLEAMKTAYIPFFRTEKVIG